ncbi:Fibropellin-1 [Trichinella zimbabwensis]|uniref:Fibropellin-1 n=1 Tax=Trichinella zimbabwensis TaxID=268475 RepID=A0A0V1I8S1_9BILA|nr:Fibropellin-1 [Trichinella zimbabwensis]
MSSYDMTMMCFSGTPCSIPDVGNCTNHSSRTPKLPRCYHLHRHQSSSWSVKLNLKSQFSAFSLRAPQPSYDLVRIIKQPLPEECIMKLFSIVVLLVLIFKADGITYTCPFESSSEIKGGKTSSDKCITIITHEYVKQHFGTKGLSTDTGHFACKKLFKNGNQMAFRNESDLANNRYVKMLEDEYFLVHAGIEQIGKAEYYTKDIYSAKIGYTILFYCYDYKMRQPSAREFFFLTRCYTYKHKALVGYVYDGIQHPWLDFCHIHKESCPDGDQGYFPKCRCLQFRKQPILKFEKLFACQMEGCTYYACVHDAYRNCEEERVRRCSIVPGGKECREYTYVSHSEQEKPYGKPCPKRDYGNICKCPCSERPWSSWSTSSHTCGKGFRQRSKPRLMYENENVDCNHQPEKCCIETESIQLNDCIEKFAHTGHSLEEGTFLCMQNGGVPVQTDEGYICKCKDPLKHGYMCEHEHDICQKYRGICQNGGTCKGKGRSYYCICPTVKGCAEENMCQNGGICIENENGLACQCRYPFTGEFCETRMLVCPPDLCKNGGTCTAYPEYDAFLCTCTEMIMGEEPPENLMSMIGIGIVTALVLIAILIYVVHRVKERKRVMSYLYFEQRNFFSTNFKDKCATI